MGKGQKVALLAIGVNLVLFGMKYLFAELSGSMALKAEAIHSLSDVIASSTVFAGLIIAKRKTRAFSFLCFLQCGCWEFTEWERENWRCPGGHWYSLWSRWIKNFIIASNPTEVAACLSLSYPNRHLKVLYLLKLISKVFGSTVFWWTAGFEYNPQMTDDLSGLKVWANADTPEQALQAREYGAQDIGLCRTEHMFMSERTEKFRIQSQCWLITFRSCNPYSGTFFEKSFNYKGSHDLVKNCSRRIKWC